MKFNVMTSTALGQIEMEVQAANVHVHSHLSSLDEKTQEEVKKQMRAALNKIVATCGIALPKAEKRNNKPS